MFKSIHSKIAVAIGTLTALVTGSASAALPAAATTAFTDIQTDGLALVDLAWPYVVAIVGAFVILRLAKRAMRQV